MRLTDKMADRLVPCRDGLVEWALDKPARSWWLGGPARPVSLRLVVDRHSLWHTRLNAARTTGRPIGLRGRLWFHLMIGTFAVQGIHDVTLGRVEAELRPVGEVRWMPADG